MHQTVKFVLVVGGLALLAAAGAAAGLSGAEAFFLVAIPFCPLAMILAGGVSAHWVYHWFSPDE